MRTRVITAVVALIFFIPVIVYGGLAIELVGAALALIAMYELFRMKGLLVVSFEGIVCGLAILALVLPLTDWLSFLPVTTDKFILYYLFIMVLMFGSVISKNEYTFEDACYPTLVSLYVGAGFSYFVEARDNSLLMIAYAFAVVWSTDIGAYMIGRKFGTKKIAPHISPNKTVEGSVGGVICAVAVSLIFIFIYPPLGFSHYNAFTLLVMSAVFSVVGQCGDLVESATKRHFDVKDSGKILPGHGGILDRFDSMLFVFPIMHLMGLF